MSVPIHSKVSIDLHPDALMLHAEVLEADPACSNAYAAAREALEAIYIWHSNVEDADEAFQQIGQQERRKSTPVSGYRAVERVYSVGDQRRVFHGNEQEVHDAAKESMTKTLKTVEARLSTLKQVAKQLDDQLNRATDYPERRNAEGVALGAEIRAHFKGLKSEERYVAVTKAINSGDKQVIAALLRSPAMLSGLDQLAKNAAGEDVPMQQFVREAAEATWAPQQKAQHSALRTIMIHAEKAATSVLQRAMKLEKTLGAASQARQHANKKLKALRGERVAK